jgi:hypothetical protein
MQFQVILKFNTLEELIEFNKLIEKSKNKNKKDSEESKQDNRGSKTKGKHQKAKLLHLQYPEKSYRECFILASQQIENDENL